MPSLACRLCGTQDNSHNLIAPCLCAKRDDALLCHTRCLLQRIEHSLQHRIDTNEQEATTCPACGKPYHLELRWRLQWSAHKALSAFSLDQYCHLLALTFMLALLLITAWFTLHPAGQFTAAAATPAPSHQQQQQSTYVSNRGSMHSQMLVGVIVVLAMVGAAVAVAQVLLRLRRHQMQVELVDDALV